MPLIELKTYKPVCDKCGEVGSTWQNIPEHEQTKALPPGWAEGALSDPRGDILRVLLCGPCWVAYQQASPDDRQEFFAPPENDSRA